MSMMKVPQIRADSTLTLTRRRLGEKGSLPTGPRQVVAPVENARRSVMKQSRSAITACAATLSAQGMRTRFHGQKKVLRKRPQHYRPKSACLLPLLRYQLTTQGAMSAIRCTFLIASRHRSRTRSPPAATACDQDLSVLTKRSANHRKFEIMRQPVRSLICLSPERRTVGPKPGLNRHDTSQNTHHLLHLHSVSTILVCIIIRHRP